jgi:hypothetical protein
LKKSRNEKTPLAFGPAADQDKNGLVGHEAFGFTGERNDTIPTENHERISIYVSVDLGGRNPSQEEKSADEEPHEVLSFSKSLNFEGVVSDSGKC